MNQSANDPEPLAFHETVETPEQVQLHLELAGLGTRSIAFLLDALIRYGVLAGVGVVVLAVFSLMHADFSGLGAELSTKIVVVGLVLLFFAVEWVYYAFFEWHWNGQTPGKRALHLRVLKDGGGPISFLDSAVRNLLRPIDSTGPMCAIGILFIFFNRKNKRPGDLVAGTIVVRERPQTLAQILAAPLPAANLAGPLADLARRIPLTNDEHQTIARYLQRRPHLDLATRQRLSQQITGAIIARARSQSPTGDIPLPPMTESERFLEALLAAHQQSPGRSA